MTPIYVPRDIAIDTGVFAQILRETGAEGFCTDGARQHRHIPITSDESTRGAVGYTEVRYALTVLQKLRQGVA